MQKSISLREALCGCSFAVRHLDGRTLRVKTQPGQVIKPNSFQVVADEGMPVHGRPFVKGNLYIAFEVSGARTAGAGCLAQRACRESACVFACVWWWWCGGGGGGCGRGFAQPLLLSTALCCSARRRCRLRMQVDFPAALEPEVVSALAAALPRAAAAADANGTGGMDEDHEEAQMKEVADMREEAKARAHYARQASSNAYDSDEDEDRGRDGRVHCAQQ
jgi:DnaJ-class molecular chaperone